MTDASDWNQKECGIYRIVHLPTNREYIGQSTQMTQRWRAHRGMLRRGEHHAYHLQRAWTKYGSGQFSFEILACCPVDHLTPLEQIMIDEFRPAFNVAKVAGSTRGVPPSPKNRAMTSARFKGVKLSAEHRAKISEAHKGRKPSEACITAVRLANTGKIHSEETRRKVSAASRGRKISEETRQKMKEAALRVWSKRKREAGL